MEQITEHLVVFVLFMVRPYVPARLGGDNCNLAQAALTPRDYPT